MSLPRIVISFGDPNGIGPEIALKAHETIRSLCRPLYCVGTDLLDNAASLLSRERPCHFNTVPVDATCKIVPGRIAADAGHWSFASFQTAVDLTARKDADAVVTLPIHKEAWAQAGIMYSGHTDMLRARFGADAIMMLGCDEMYVALFTEHIPLCDVARHVRREPLTRFLVDLYRTTGFDDIAVLGLNPHAGDGGVLGDEEGEIAAAIEAANNRIAQGFKCDGRPFFGPVVPDVAFTPRFREKHRRFVAMYHDQGLAPLKALYFDRSVNISLNLPIVRTSVDHGTAFDIAYRGIADTTSYIEAVKTAAAFTRRFGQ